VVAVGLQGAASIATDLLGRVGCEEDVAGRYRGAQAALLQVDPIVVVAVAQQHFAFRTGGADVAAGAEGDALGRGGGFGGFGGFGGARRQGEAGQQICRKQG